ncbi:hypothetical protein [Streptomyces sp. 6N223]|uniref:hypothetical protein n=1 Tax=Streptomyces sp. 6N223 TaxID=3457412 RepID=UPI003FD5E58A
MPFPAHPHESASESETDTKTKAKTSTESETGNELGLSPDDILVVIGHPFGDVVVPLGHWIATGPGPRPYVRPLSARSRATGEPLPLSIIPLRYRNDEEARQAIRDGRVEDPWAPGRS